MLKKIVVCLLVLLQLVLFVPSQPTSATPPSDEDRIEQILARMTVREKVGQLFMVTLYGSRLLESNETFLQEYAPGAVALFRSNLDYQSAAETTTLINSYQTTMVTADHIPMIVATDQEGGRVWRLLNGFTHFPPPMYMGALTPEMAFEVGKATGREMAAVGVNMNLAPVVDLTNRAEMLNPNHVLFTRTMGDNPTQVGTNAGAYIRGMSANHVMGVLKHFPGHSPTNTDSHHDLSQIDLDSETFRNTNLLAFQTAIEGGAEVVMLGHLYYPAIEPIPNRPATLSPTIVGLLRNGLDFDGIILTDAFDMGAIQNYFDSGEAAVIAFNAGVDMIAVGPNLAFSEEKAMMDYVYQAAQSGELPMAKIDDAVRRILRLKLKYGILDWEALDASETETRIHQIATSTTLLRVFASGMTIVRDEQQVLPLSSGKNVAIIYPAKWVQLAKTCRDTLPDADFLGYTYTPLNWEYNAAVNKANTARVVIVFAENLYTNGGQRALIDRLPLAKTVLVSLGSPYDIEQLAALPAGYVLGYTSVPEAQIAACQVLAGRVEAEGLLPVTLEGITMPTAVADGSGKN